MTREVHHFDALIVGEAPVGVVEPDFRRILLVALLVVDLLRLIRVVLMTNKLLFIYFVIY